MPMLVKTPPGLICPKEGAPREYITDSPSGCEVPDTVYYRRLLAEGSLLQILPDPPPKEREPISKEAKANG